MEFKKFCKERSRMCDKYLICEDVACKGCPLDYIRSDAEGCLSTCVGNPDEAEKIVSEWVKEHPVVTNADKFREVFGVSIGSFGAPCPGALTIYGIGIIPNQEWLEQEYKPPRKEETDGQS